jgi:hypothetical protein
LLQLEPEELRFFLLAALLLPLRRVEVAGQKNKKVPAAVSIVRDAIKWRSKDGDMAVQLHEGVSAVTHGGCTEGQSSQEASFLTVASTTL